MFAPEASCVLSAAAMDHLQTFSVFVCLDVTLATLETQLGADAMARQRIGEAR